ncbi:MAG: DUF2202 domain-containing protein [Candidatus Kapaibacterium sp.]
MKTNILASIFTIIIFAGFLNGNIFISEAKAQDKHSCYYAIDLPKQDVSAEEEKEMLYMIEEEKMARDFYITMYDKWGLRPFGNIKEAEQKHMDAIESLLNKYGIVNPVSGLKTGEFKNEKIKNLYLSLLNQGNKSALDALKAAAEIEEIDIKDLMDAVKDTDNKDIAMVYNNLKRASENHLRAFTRNINRRDEVYTPKHLDKDYFNEIVNL